MDVKVIRIVAIGLVIAFGFSLCQLLAGPTEAASQVGGTQAENAPPAGEHVDQDPGAASYAKHCAVCHGQQREGNLPGFPPLMGIAHRMSENQISDLIHKGKGRMPGFPKLQDGELTVLLHYLVTPGPASQAAGNAPKGGEGSDIAEAGRALFHQNCSFCHGAQAQGTDQAPGLVRNTLVNQDRNGDVLGPIIKEGRPAKGMPAFGALPPETIADVEASGRWPGKVVTEVEPAGPFWEAEPEHQDYLERYPHGYTCHYVRPDWVLPLRTEAAVN